MMDSYAGMTGIGCYQPLHSPLPAELIERFGFQESFLKDKIGFDRWPQAAADESVSDMAVQAVEKLEERVSCIIEDVECLILVTQNPDYKLPTTANVLQERLGMSQHALCFDINQGCSGFVLGLATIGSLMYANDMHRGLLITSDAYSKVQDAEDRHTVPLFGDGAAATLIETGKGPRALSWIWGSDGSGAKSLIVPGGGSRNPKLVIEGEGALFMNGRDIYGFAIRRVPEAIRECVLKAGLTLDDVDLFIIHQASAYLVQGVAKALRVDKDRCPFLLRQRANTVSSTIPMSIDELGGIQALVGKKVLLCGFGVGLSWGAVLLQF